MDIDAAQACLGFSGALTSAPASDSLASHVCFVHEMMSCLSLIAEATHLPGWEDYGAKRNAAGVVTRFAGLACEQIARVPVQSGAAPNEYEDVFGWMTMTDPSEDQRVQSGGRWPMRSRAVGSRVSSAGFPSRFGRHAVGLTYLSLGLVFHLSCQPPTLFDKSSGDPTGQDAPKWRDAFDYRDPGVFSGVWGSAPDDVFIVGGTVDQGEVRHLDGQRWQKTVLPDTLLLVWVFGFGPADVYAVGVKGIAPRFDGFGWRSMETGVDVGLWGVLGLESERRLDRGRRRRRGHAAHSTLRWRRFRQARRTAE